MPTETPEICLSFLTFHSERLLIINFAIFWLKRRRMNSFQWVLRDLWFIFRGPLCVSCHLEKKLYHIT